MNPEIRSQQQLGKIDHYGVAFDNDFPPDKCFPEVLQINIFGIEADEGEYTNEYLPFTVDPADCIGKKILAVPRCCRKRKGSTDRRRVNGSVAEIDVLRQGVGDEAIKKLLVGHGVCSTKTPEKAIRHSPPASDRPGSQGSMKTVNSPR